MRRETKLPTNNHDQRTCARTGAGRFLFPNGGEESGVWGEAGEEEGSSAPWAGQGPVAAAATASDATANRAAGAAFVAREADVNSLKIWAVR